jgi:hypothetical protein
VVVCSVMKMRLQELGLKQKELATLARDERLGELRRAYVEPRGAILTETRELILR